MSKLPSIPIIAAITALAAIPCAAQSASIAVTHNHPTGLIQPGETIRITATLSWTGAHQAAAVVGSISATPNFGVASNPQAVAGGWFTPPSFGTPTGGSLLGVDLRVVPSFFTGAAPGPWQILSGGLPFISYDWTAPSTPGTIDFNWTPDPAFPTPLFYLTFFTEVRSPLPTTYHGTSITVIPAPASLTTLVAISAIAPTRRRRAPSPR